MIQEVTPRLMIRRVNYFERSEIQLIFLFNLANIIIDDDDDAAVPRKFISYDHTCSDKLKLFKLDLNITFEVSALAQTS